MSDTLLGCPFCGGVGQALHASGWTISCVCGGNVGWHNTELAATAKWNNRRQPVPNAAERGAVWMPLEDGQIGAFTYIDNGGKLLGVFAGDDYSDWYATDDLPDNIRLCQLTQDDSHE